MQLLNTVLRKSPNSKETVNTYAQSLEDLNFCLYGQLPIKNSLQVAPPAAGGP